MRPIMKIEHVSKEYRLGAIGGGTLRGDLQSWWARVQGKEDPNSMIGTKALKTSDGKRFLALNDVSFDVMPGETLGIIGHNGAGKSTLLKLVSRVTAPTAGTISYDGRITSMLEVGTGFHPELTGRENIFMNGAILGMTRAEVARKLDEIIDFAEIRDFVDTPVKRYSSGMYVKLAFSVAAHLDSEIMVMDEVLAVGDVNFQRKCLGKMKDVATENGRTILYVSHNMATIRQLCNRVVVLDHGQVVHDGNIDTGIRKYMDDLVDMQCHNDFRNAHRPKNMGHRAKMVELNIPGKSDANLTSRDPAFFQLKIESDAELRNVFFRVIFRFQDDTPIGMMSTIDPILLSKGKTYTRNLTMDLSMFASGRYTGSIYLYQIDTMGKMDNIDVVENAFSFEVYNENLEVNRMQWFHNSWGHTVLPHITLGSEEVEG